MYIQALIVAALSASASAANCWPSVTNGIYTSDVGVQLAWNLRSTLCLNYWNSNTRVQTYHGADWGDCGTNWKGAGSSFCWGGYFQALNAGNQQTCWDTSEEIINQCASGPGGFIHPTGGNWIWGNTRTEGGYYQDGNYYTRRRGLKASREELAGQAQMEGVVSVEEQLNATGQDFRIVEVNLDMSVATDVTYHLDGTSTNNVEAK
ncbi:hypothetical protein DL95DRAFT_502541 [Leptodontidium sp. 2 PMI_412]|nr:hypothetical protein BKA61DRAFT_570682 [Leptodontidium sp. MPI-SDFR-AT-0119]KAH9214846.1 hypothetical protein DL95DRAFT_502541 [Leptodontidium sp. 2 PMI_412]